MFVICGGQQIRLRSTDEAEVQAAVMGLKELPDAQKAPHVEWRTDESSTENGLSCKLISAQASRVRRGRHLEVNALWVQDETRSRHL